MKLFRTSIVCGMLSVICLTSFSAHAGNSNSLQIKGSDTMVNLVQSWAEKYMESNPDSFIAVTGGGSGTGIASMINGTCDIAASSREMKGPEIALAEKKGIQPKEHSVALDGLAVVVHPSNPVTKLTLGQLADIFTGKITNWKELGGSDAKIVVLSREVNSGTHVYFKEHVLRHGDSASKEEFSADALLLSSSQAIADEVSNNQASIGYYGMGYISPKQKAVSVAAKEGAVYEDPTVENVISGAYPISRPLYLYTNGEGRDDVNKFIEYILSSEGQALVSTQDFVPVKK